MGCHQKPNNKLRHEAVDCSRGVPPQAHQQASPHRTRLKPAPENTQHFTTTSSYELHCNRLLPPKTHQPEGALEALTTSFTKRSIAAGGCPRTNNLRHVEVDCHCGVPENTPTLSPRRAPLQPVIATTNSTTSFATKRSIAAGGVRRGRLQLGGVPASPPTSFAT